MYPALRDKNEFYHLSLFFMNIAVLASTRGTDLQAIIDACAQNELKAKIEEEGIGEWVDGNIGSKLTMKYPSLYSL